MRKFRWSNQKDLLFSTFNLCSAMAGTLGYIPLPDALEPFLSHLLNSTRFYAFPFSEHLPNTIIILTDFDIYVNKFPPTSNFVFLRRHTSSSGCKLHSNHNSKQNVLSATVTKTAISNTNYITKADHCAAELCVSIFYAFKTKIANEISSFK